MKKTYIRGVTIVTALMALMLMAQQASAVVKFPRLARAYTVWFARAMDECVPANDAGGPTVTVVGTPNVPEVGCLQQNVVTDSSLTMMYGKLFINSQGRVGVFAVGLPFGARVKLELTIRATRTIANVKHPPSSNAKVTFEDVTVTCPNTPFAIPVRPNGAAVSVLTLASCLGSSFSGEQAGNTVFPANVEILGAALLNADTGKTFAVPGIAR